MAAAQGVPVRALGLVFLGLVGLVAGEATQAVGALLLLGLVAALQGRHTAWRRGRTPGSRSRACSHSPPYGSDLR